MYVCVLVCNNYNNFNAVYFNNNKGKTSRFSLQLLSGREVKVPDYHSCLNACHCNHRLWNDELPSLKARLFTTLNPSCGISGVDVFAFNKSPRRRVMLE